MTPEEIAALQKRLDEFQGSVDKAEKLFVTKENFEATTKKLDLLDEQMRGISEALKTRSAKPDGSGEEKVFSLPGAEDEVKKGRRFLISQAIKMATGQFQEPSNMRKNLDLAFTFDVYKDAKKRDAAAGVGPSGGFLVPVEAMQPVTELLTANMVTKQAGAQIDSFSGSPVPYPKETSQQTAAYVGENTTITASDVGYGEILAQARKLAAMTKMSNEWLKLASPGTAEASINRRLLSALGLKWDISALRGDGIGRDPVGVVNHPDVTLVHPGTNGDTLDYAFLLSLRLKLAQANALQRPGAKLAWIMSPEAENKILNLPTSALVLYPLDPTSGSGSAGNTYQQRLLGYPVYTTTQIPSNLAKGSGTTLSEVFFGAWDDLHLPEWGSIMVLASNLAGTAFADDQTWIRGIHMNDVAIPRGASFVVGDFVVT